MMLDTVKQSVLLVLALGGIAALVTDDPAPKAPPKPEKELDQPVQPSPIDEVDEDDAYWSDELDEEGDEEAAEEFVFGEPMVEIEDDNPIAKPSSEKGPSASTSSLAKPVFEKSGPGKVRQPAPGTLGSPEKPMVLGGTSQAARGTRPEPPE